MNEIQLLRTAGPDATPLTPGTLHAARAALLAEIAAAPARADLREPASVVAARQLAEEARSRGGATARRRPRRAVALRIGAAVLTAAAALTTVLLVTGPDGAAPRRDAPRDGVELVDFQLPAFPLTATTLPPGAGEPVFGADDSGAAMSFPSTADPLENMSIYVGAEPPPPGGSLSFPGWVPEDVTVNGAPAVLVLSVDPAMASVDWERAPGQWVTIHAQGRYAERDVLLGFAAGLVDGPQEVPVQLHLAPAGYSLDVTKDDGRIIILADDADPERSLVIRLLAPGEDPVPVLGGATDAPPAPATEVTVQRQPAQLVRSDAGAGGRQGWVLQALLPDGSAFVVEAPGDLTEAQVVEIADQVSSTP